MNEHKIIDAPMTVAARNQGYPWRSVIVQAFDSPTAGGGVNVKFGADARLNGSYRFQAAFGRKEVWSMVKAMHPAVTLGVLEEMRAAGITVTGDVAKYLWGELMFAEQVKLLEKAVMETKKAA